MPTEPKKRPMGRPKKADAPMVPWREVDALLVLGEEVLDEKTGKAVRRYPSFRDLGRRYGVSTSLIGKYASRHNCLKRREENKAREQIQFEKEVIKKRVKARAVSTSDAVQIIDDYLIGFRDAIAAGEVRYDSPGDFNTLARLKEFLLGGADSRQELQGSVSLAEIQSRHLHLRRQLEGLDDAQTGAANTDADREDKDGAAGGKSVH